MEQYTDPAALQTICRTWRNSGQRIGFVPTMGALHEGHLSLVRAARKQSDQLIVSIFVNPTQFGPNEDFDDYPRQLAKDMALLKEEGVDVVFSPSADSIYRDGHQTRVNVSTLTNPLCGENRPSHFSGVTTVVTILLQIVQPDAVYLGRKDYQQFRIIERMVQDLFIPTEVVGLPIIREPDGLALSSRNAHLSKMGRERANFIIRGLQNAKDAFLNGTTAVDELRNIISEHIEERCDAVHYIAIVDNKTLQPIRHIDRPALMAIAVVIEGVRLIDNLEIGPRA
tara:strand:+ start:678 stop:1526 length:849 start_codon:yes stop_codon:yes gene_type:complete